MKKSKWDFPITKLQKMIMIGSCIWWFIFFVLACFFGVWYFIIAYIGVLVGIITLIFAAAQDKV